MRKLSKLLTCLSIFMLTLSLAACGTADKAKVKKVSNPVTETKDAETTNEAEAQLAANTEKKTAETAAASPAEQKPEQETVQSDTATQTKPQSQSSTTAKPTTSTSNAGTNTNNNATPANNNSITAPANSTTAAEGSTAPAAPVQETQKPAPATTVTFSIVGPDNHVILAATKVNIKDGDTVFTVLKNVDGIHNSFRVESRGSGATAYIEGISGENFSYYEFDYGPRSGWVFKQNGASLTKGVGVTAVKDGDRIECIYTE